jgi:hypothetical protein
VTRHQASLNQSLGCLTVEILKSDEVYVASLATVLQVVRETGSGEADETGSQCIELSVTGQQVADPAQALQVSKSHLLVPLCLSDGQERRPGAIGMA